MVEEQQSHASAAPPRLGGLLSTLEAAVALGRLDAAECGGRERARVRESVHRPATEHLVCLSVGEVLARDIHNHKRVEIDVCLERNAIGLLRRQSDYGHRRLLRPRRKWPRGGATNQRDELAPFHYLLLG
jgi:hypothetical protein